MKFTLSDCIERINQVLNYPSVTYSDISHYFDQAISELNTTFHTSIKSFTEIVKNSPSFPTDGHILVLASEPTEATTIFCGNEDEANTQNINIYYNTSDYTFYVKESDTWNSYDNVYAVYNNSTDIKRYIAVYIGSGIALWSTYSEDILNQIDIIDYMPYDWIVLFFIPYICFKYSVRSGEDSNLYYDEFTQGIQQLQLAYDIPEYLPINKVAGNPIYTEDIKKALNNFGYKIPVRAVTEDMKTPVVHLATYGGFNDRGGWDI